MSAEVFIDTNILIYAHDAGSGAKHPAAQEVLRGVWRSETRVAVSAQVLQEMTAQMIRRGAAPAAVDEILDVYGEWNVVPGTLRMTRDAIGEMTRWKISWWDALILAAARQAGARELWSEDFSDGQDYGGIRAVNPLRKGRNK